LADRLFPIPPQESEGAYFEAFGRFIAAYAAAESSVHQVARFLTGLSDDKARVMLAGMRLGDLSERIRGLLRSDNGDTERGADIEACLVQIDNIQTARNKLIHRSITFIEGRFQVTNIHTAKRGDQAQTETISKAELENMQGDCNMIFLRLLERISPMTMPVDLPEGFANWKAFLQKPWRYTPAPPAPQKKSPPQAPPAPQPPPDASQT